MSKWHRDCAWVGERQNGKVWGEDQEAEEMERRIMAQSEILRPDLTPFLRFRPPTFATTGAAPPGIGERESTRSVAIKPRPLLWRKNRTRYMEPREPGPFFCSHTLIPSDEKYRLQAQSITWLILMGPSDGPFRHPSTSAPEATSNEVSSSNTWHSIDVGPSNEADLPVIHTYRACGDFWGSNLVSNVAIL